jgi:hypothetical protein
MGISMKSIIKKISFFLLGILTTMLLGFSIYSFIPVGSINGETVYNYQLQARYKSMKSNAIKNIAKDEIFFNAISELGITVSDAEISKGLDGYYERYGGKNELELVLTDTLGDIETLKISIKKGIMAEKAIKYFAEQEVGDQDERQQKGNEKYTQLIESLEEKTTVSIY